MPTAKRPRRTGVSSERLIITIERDESGGFYAVLLGRSNRKPQWRTSESYARRRTLLKAIEAIRLFARDSEVIDLTRVPA